MLFSEYVLCSEESIEDSSEVIESCSGISSEKNTDMEAKVNE